MSKLTSLVLLIHSLSKSERKKISTILGDGKSDYIYLFKIIDRELLSDATEIKNRFAQHKGGAALNVTVSYLFDTLLDILADLRSEQDSYFSLFNMLLQAKVLYEKSIYKECFAYLDKVKTKAAHYGNFAILLIAQKIEMEYLLTLDFPKITETELLDKQFKIRNTLNKIRKINEHTFLYELLRHRVIYKKQKHDFNDLIVSEISIVSNSGFNNFEIEKNHKLFQSNYLMYIGDYKSALNSLYELNNVFEKNMHLLSNPPAYYLSTIEGVLESLRTMRNYEAMNYFIEKLSAIKSSSNHFKIQILCAVFLYKIFPLIDTERFAEAKELLSQYGDSLFDKSSSLAPARYFKLMLYEAIIYFGNKEYEKAKKKFFKVFYNGKTSMSIPHYKAARLLYLMSLYELNELDDIGTEINSIRRDYGKNICPVEHAVIKFIRGRHGKVSGNVPHTDGNTTRADLQLLRIFDFTLWMAGHQSNRQ
ncbi:MAG: hypothetical protein LBG17_06720 [Bacteroidales bacterium]|jgi:hypothetical protein|nr:hypothetical protein [Bacteroidales bacterium]